MRGHITKKGKRWYIVVDLPKTATGKRKQKWYSGYASKKEAEKSLPGILQNHNRNASVILDNTTVEQLLDDWLQVSMYRKVSPRTYARYEQIVRDYLKPEFGCYPLSALRPMAVQRFYSDLQNRLAPATVQKIHNVFHSAIKQGMAWCMIEHDPLSNIQLPKPMEREMQVWDRETVREFLERLQGSKLYIPMLLAFSTGARQGEISSLRWKNLTDQMISIDRSMNRNGTLKEPKTRGSRRSIHLTPFVISQLQQHRIWQKENKLQYGSEYAANDFICTHENGLPMLPHYLGESFRNLVKRSDLPYIRFHDIRHTFATLLLSGGTNPKIVSEILGHSSVKTTMDIYSHVLPNMQEGAAKLIQGMLFG